MLVNQHGDPINTHVARWEEARAGREHWTREAFIDRQYLAGKTWQPHELAVFRAEDRDPPNYNLTAPMVQLVAGLEAQNRSDIKYLPRGPQDISGAQAVTKLAKKVCDDNGFGRKLSRTFHDAISVGIGWMEVGKNRNPLKDPITQDSVDAFDVWVDPACRDVELTDALDVFRAKYMRPSQLARLVPTKADEIMMLKGADGESWTADLSHSSDYYNNYGDTPSVGSDEWNGGYQGGTYRGGRTRIIQAVERWYRVEAWERFVKYKDGRVVPVPMGMDRDAQAKRQALATAIVDGAAQVVDGWVHNIRMALFAEGLLLTDVESPFTHRQFPLVPMWAYQDEYGRPMGLVRQVRTPQRDFNARMSNMLKRALTKQTWYEADAFEDVDAVAEALTDPNGLIPLAKGGIGKIKLVNDLDASPQEMSILQTDMKMITDRSGVTQELAGQASNAVAASAIAQRKQQGQTALFTLLDNRNWTLERCGELTLAGIQQEYTGEMAVRVTESAKGLDFIFVNKVDPASGAVLNDISQAKFDTVVTEANAQATERMAQVEALADFLAPMPVEVKLAFAPKLAMLADLPDAEEVAAQLEAMTAALMGGGAPGGAPAGPGGPAPAGPAPSGPPAQGQAA